MCNLIARLSIGWMGLHLASCTNSIHPTGILRAGVSQSSSSTRQFTQKSSYSACLLRDFKGYLQQNRLDLAMQMVYNPAFNINAKDQAGVTALMTAVFYGHQEVVHALLQRQDINVNAKDNNDWTALMYAVFHRNGHQEVANALLQHQDINVNAKEDQAGVTALIYAASNGYRKIVNALLQHEGINVNVQTNRGYTALISLGYHAIVNALL